MSASLRWLRLDGSELENALLDLLSKLEEEPERPEATAAMATLMAGFSKVEGEDSAMHCVGR